MTGVGWSERGGLAELARARDRDVWQIGPTFWAFLITVICVCCPHCVAAYRLLGTAVWSTTHSSEFQRTRLPVRHAKDRHTARGITQKRRGWTVFFWGTRNFGARATKAEWTSVNGQIGPHLYHCGARAAKAEWTFTFVTREGHCFCVVVALGPRWPSGPICHGRLPPGPTNFDWTEVRPCRGTVRGMPRAELTPRTV